ncbi:hypothetical protein B7R25_00115 [Subtercola boreus]|uniref:3-carboxymuconate cyclase n=1 Tax=Subtercola boreus TaxID=120213 RepID=A0A3E0WEL4_9MICO|nr:hypothetical protein B7R24_00120 [Subtercola boreus]RFA24071.1 hypothetical protein B7R23_00120 [Subtercola boreus]RFA29772.1 hypothetical protein B7R25_00115 [Subtercola boreus]
MWVGCYTADSGREGVGIGLMRLFAPGGAAADAPQFEWVGTAVAAPSPSFMAVHPTLPVVYAVGEAAQTVAAYRRTGARAVGDNGTVVDGDPATGTRGESGTLESLGDPWEAGEAVCHVAVDPAGRFITATCWGDGRVLLYGLDDAGRIVSRFVAAPAADPHTVWALTTGPVEDQPPRQSRAHASLMLADGRVMTTDLGFDLVRVWRVIPFRANAPKNSEVGAFAQNRDHPSGLELDHEIVLPFGSGPRHLVQHPNGTVLIVTEYSVEVVVLEPQAEPGARSAGARFAVSSVGPATQRGARPGDAGAEITLTPGTGLVHVTVRGSNLVSTLRMDDRGTVHPIADVSSGGDWPRHHLVLPAPSGSNVLLLVAHERSNDVTVFALDPDTGLLEAIPSARLHVEAPTALVPA